ncbi:MAG: acyltransferase [Candidatus Hydrogenedentes bacterium]|nr:acyltransferase [Candidatus Hydrogenedentota bacterium]
MPSLNRIRWLWDILNRSQLFIYNRFWGMDIHPSALVSLKAKLDRTHPAGVHIGAESMITLGVTILAHDMSRTLRTHTRIGARCFVGANAIIMPGVSVGDGSIVAAGAVVTKDVPPASIVAGNPAKVIRAGITVREFGILSPRPQIDSNLLPK